MLRQKEIKWEIEQLGCQPWPLGLCCLISRASSERWLIRDSQPSPTLTDELEEKGNSYLSREVALGPCTGEKVPCKTERRPGTAARRVGNHDLWPPFRIIPHSRVKVNGRVSLEPITADMPNPSNRRGPELSQLETLLESYLEFAPQLCFWDRICPPPSPRLVQCGIRLEEEPGGQPAINPPWLVGLHVCISQYMPMPTVPQSDCSLPRPLMDSGWGCIPLPLHDLSMVHAFFDLIVMRCATRCHHYWGNIHQMPCFCYHHFPC